MSDPQPAVQNAFSSAGSSWRLLKHFPSWWHQGWRCALRHCLEQGCCCTVHAQDQQVAQTVSRHDLGHAPPWTAAIKPYFFFHLHFASWLSNHLPPKTVLPVPYLSHHEGYPRWADTVRKILRDILVFCSDSTAQLC